MIDLDAWVERAAIMQFDAGMSRVRSETLAAERQGCSRHEVLDEIRKRRAERSRNRAGQVAGERREDALSGVQPASQKEAGSVSQRDEDV